MSITTGSFKFVMGAKSRHRANLAVGYAAKFLDIARNNGAN